MVSVEVISEGFRVPEFTFRYGRVVTEDPAANDRVSPEADDGGCGTVLTLIPSAVSEATAAVDGVVD